MSMSDNKTPKITFKDKEIRLLNKKGYKIMDVLNSGSFASVYKAINKNKQYVAAKVFDASKLGEDYRFKFLPRELYTMKKLKHQFIIETYDVYTIDNHVFVFMELAEGGDILTLILTNGPLPEPKAKIIYKQISDGLRYMHSIGISHRDLKCDNILMNKTKDIAKLADFGFSRTCFDNISGKRLLSDTFCGSASYASPEVLNQRPYDAMLSDVWSLGVVLFIMLNKTFPFKGNDVKIIRANQMKKQYEFGNTLSDSVKDLIRKQLEPEVKSRLTMVQVCAHQWLKN